MLFVQLCGWFYVVLSTGNGLTDAKATNEPKPIAAATTTPTPTTTPPKPSSTTKTTTTTPSTSPTTTLTTVSAPTLTTTTEPTTTSSITEATTSSNSSDTLSPSPSNNTTVTETKPSSTPQKPSIPMSDTLSTPTTTQPSPTHAQTNMITTTTKPVNATQISSSRPNTAATNDTQQNANGVTTSDNGGSLSAAPTTKTSLGANSTDVILITDKPLSKNSSTTQSPLQKIYTLMSKYTLAAATVAVVATAAPNITTMSTTTAVPLKYSTMAFNEDNKTCPFGYSPDTTVHACVHLCEVKNCQNGGQCYVELDINNATVSKCRCKETSKDIYTGDNCESSKMSRGRERGITLGVLITMNVLFFLLIFLMCVKLKRGGNKLRAAQKSYDVNNL